MTQISRFWFNPEYIHLDK